MNASKEPMNDAVSAPQVSHGLAADQVGAADGEVVSACSTLIDGPISDQDWDALWQDSRLQSSALEDWNAYQIVGDALRGGVPLVAVTPPATFLANFQARLQKGLAAEPGKSASAMPDGLVSPPAAYGSQATAANDAVFRWKMLAMAASISAVMAVSWGVLGTLAGEGAMQTGSQLAQVAPVAPPAEVVVADPVGVESSIIVNTGQGPLIRDARLEALLAEHRQYGGLSALQKPAGFLRNATYDAPDR